MKKYDITIIGYGITGMLLLAILNQQNIDLSRICIIDPHFDGGALMREYGDVLSNTPLCKAVDALKLINPEYVLPEWCSQYNLNSITPLFVLAHLIKDFTNHILQKVDTYETMVKSLEYRNTWNIKTDDESISIESSTIYLCQGSNAKKLKCNIPSIPLHIALNKSMLKKYVQPTDKIIVFGTSHSGTLVLENLETLGIETKAIHKNKSPFLFAKDGDYDGLKEEAERIANSILKDEYKHIELIHMNHIDKIIKYTKTCNWCIYAIGFEASKISCNIDLSKYDNTSGKILNTESAYGFGIAYPSLAPDSIHVDVGVLSFVEHIQKHFLK